MAAWARETGVDPPLHRVHGRRPLERLAARRGRAGRRADRRVGARLAGRARRPGYRGEVADRWRYLDGARRVRGHLVGDPSRSAATARGPACPPTASSTRACSRSQGTTSARSSAVGASDDELIGVHRRRSGRAGTTATRSCARPRRLGRSAEGRDVRDGRLSALRPLTTARRLVHTLSTAVAELRGQRRRVQPRCSWITALTRRRRRPVP